MRILIYFDPRLKASEACVATFESKISDLEAQSVVSDTSLEDLLREINELSRCLQNIIIYGLPKSKYKDANVKKNFDSSKIAICFQQGVLK